jgi:hypothetical protein
MKFFLSRTRKNAAKLCARACTAADAPLKHAERGNMCTRGCKTRNSRSLTDGLVPPQGPNTTEARVGAPAYRGWTVVSEVSDDE